MVDGTAVRKAERWVVQKGEKKAARSAEWMVESWAFCWVERSVESTAD